MARRGKVTERAGGYGTPGSRTVGQHVAWRRREMDWTQLDVAKRLGFSRPYVAQIEADESDEKTYALLVKLARALEEDVAVLLEDCGLTAQYAAAVPAQPAVSEGAKLVQDTIAAKFPKLTRRQAKTAIAVLAAVVGEPPPPEEVDPSHQEPTPAFPATP